MSKLRLSLEDLQVETFSPDDTLRRLGTVLGLQQQGVDAPGEEDGTILSVCPSCPDTCAATCSGGCQVTECGSACRKTWNDPYCWTRRTNGACGPCRTDEAEAEFNDNF